LPPNEPARPQRASRLQFLGSRLAAMPPFRNSTQRPASSKRADKMPSSSIKAWFFARWNVARQWAKPVRPSIAKGVAAKITSR